MRKANIGTTFVSGDVKDGSGIAGCMDARTRNVISLTVAEVADQGGYMEGKIEGITSEQVQVPEKKDWYSHPSYKPEDCPKFGTASRVYTFFPKISLDIMNVR